MINVILKEVDKLVRKYRTRDPFEIADSMIITIRYDDLGALKGFYFYQYRFRYIVINENIDDILKTVICAHELGHDRLHQPFAKNGTINEFSLFDMSSKPEREANLFATELLISDCDMIDFVNYRYTYDFIARELGIPIEIIDFKSQILKNKGYRIEPLGLAKGDFLKIK
jgi:Zn-dependent peptidase ImmA (M78 family)